MALAAGACAGWVTKALDGQGALGDLGSLFGLWVVVVSLLSARSRTAERSMLLVLAFPLSMLAAYFAYSVQVLGFTPARYVLAWAALALGISPLFSCLVWRSRGYRMAGCVRIRLADRAAVG